MAVRIRCRISREGVGERSCGGHAWSSSSQRQVA